MVWSDTAFGAGKVARLTAEAVRYAILLNRLDVPANLMSQAVYDFNRLPFASLPQSLWWYAGSAALADNVQRDLAAGGCHLDARYQRRLDVESRWIYWETHSGEAQNKRLRHKVYVSPSIRALRETLAVVARLCEAMGVVSFKLGLDAHGILRSDKMVVYFTDPESRQMFVREALSCTEGLDAHGVPLTRGAGASGLLSTAEDPLMGALSWRQLISAELVDILKTERDRGRGASVEVAIETVGAELVRRGLMPALTAAA